MVNIFWVEFSSADYSSCVEFSQKPGTDRKNVKQNDSNALCL